MMRQSWLRLSFAQRQLGLVLLAILPLLFLAMFFLAWGIREYREAVENGLSDTAHALTIAMDEQVVTWRSALEALSTSPAFDDRDFSKEFYDQLVAVAKQHQGDIVIFDESLAQRLNTRRPYGEPLPKAGYPEPKRRAFATGLPQVSGPFVGAVAKRSLVALDVPVMRDGRTIYSLNISFPSERISDLLSQEPLSRGRIVHVINQDGLFVGRSADAAEVVGQAVPPWYAEAIARGESGIVEGPSPATRVEEAEQVLAFHRLHQVPWTLAVAASKADLSLAWQKPLWLFAGMSLLIVLITVALTWLFSRRVTRPIEELAAAASDILEGRRTEIAPVKIPELETLRQALERAATVARERFIAEIRAAMTEETAEEMRQSEERQRLLAREVDHRAKNLLAVVQSILTLTQADDAESYKQVVSGRITALAHSHDLIAASRWRGADLVRIMNDQLAPYRAKEGSTARAQVGISGPSLTFLPAAAQSFAMVIHELATNAVKYGALSTSEGRLSVKWRLAEDGLSLTWDEAGGPPLAGPPQRHSFGMRVITASIQHELNGCVTFDWQKKGLLVTILLPVEQVAAKSTAAHSNKPSAFATKDTRTPDSLAGRRILVVEDEMLIAGQTESLLDKHGCSIIGPAPRLDAALALARAELLDAAILDVNLSGSPSDPVADVLSKRGIPFVVLTGYADSALSVEFRAAPVVSKPFEEETLMKILALEISKRLEIQRTLV